MGLRLLLIAVLMAVQASAAAVTPPWERKEAFPLVPPAGKGLKALRPLTAGPANGSFEAVDGVSGQPTGWGIYRGGIPTLVEGRGGPGSRAGRLGGGTGYWQTLAFDVPLYQTVTVATWARGSLGVERLRLVMEAYSAADRYLSGAFPTRSEQLPPGVWAPVYHAYTRTQAEEAKLSVLMLARADSHWMDVDDVTVLTEGFRNGGFDLAGSAEPTAGWVLADGASIDGAAGTLVLPAGASARQLAAESLHGKDYFIYTEGGAGAMLRATRRDSSGTALGAAELLEPSPTGDARGGLVYTVPRGYDGTVSEVEISAPAGAEMPIRVGGAWRGFVQAWPDRVIAAAGSPIPTVRLTAAWPGVLATASLEIVDAGGMALLAVPLSQERDSVWAEFDGGGLPAGNYRGRFRLANADGTMTAVREVPFAVERTEPFAAGPKPYVFDGYARMPWIWMYPFTPEMVVETADEAEAMLRPAKEDGFNFFLIITSADQFAVVKEGARRVGVPYIVYEPAITDLLLNREGLTWHPDLYFREMEPFLKFSGDPLFRGVYLRDEPNLGDTSLVGTNFNDRTRRLMLLMERDGRYGAGFAFQTGSPAKSLAGTDFPVVSTYYYPVAREPRTNEARFVGLMAETEEDIAFARAAGKPYWAGFQGYASMNGDPAMSPAQVSAQFGCSVAAGAEGYFTFVYYTLSPIGGLRTRHGEPSPRLAPYLDFNARMEALWPLLKTFSPTRTAPPQTNVIARVTTDPDQVPHAVVVNYEERALDVEVETAGPATMRNVESPAGDAEGTTHTLTLAPGAWAVLRFDGAAPVRFTGTYPPAPPRKVANVRETGRLETGASPTRLALNPAGGNFATITGDRFRVYTRDGRMILNDYATFGMGFVRYAGPNRLVGANNRLGFRIYDLPTTDTVTLALERLRFTGGALDVAPDASDGKAWIAMAYDGVGRASLAGGGVALTGFLPSISSNFLSLHGPFADGSVIAMEDTYGPYRIEEAPDGSLTGERFEESNLFGYSRISPNGRRIATANVDRGATVYDVDANGRLLARTRIVDPELIQAEAVAWLADDTLAVTDLHRGVRFYRVRRGDWTPLGVWKPAPEPFQIASMDATAQGEVAVGLSTGRVVFADATAVKDEGRAEGWMVE